MRVKFCEGREEGGEEREMEGCRSSRRCDGGLRKQSAERALGRRLREGEEKVRGREEEGERNREDDGGTDSGRQRK